MTVLEYFRLKLDDCELDERYVAAMKSMPLESNCGGDCRKVIDAATALVDLLADVNDGTHATIVQATSHQCAVYICG